MSENEPQNSGNWRNRLSEKLASLRGKLGRRASESSETSSAPASFKERLTGIGPRFQAKLNQLRANLKEAKWETTLQKLDPTSVAEWASRTFQQQGAGLYLTLGTIFLCTYFLADLTALLVGRYIPEPPYARLAKTTSQAKKTHNLDEYGIIFTRNLFNSEGKIPGEESGGPSSGGPQDPGGAPVRTTLPFNLIGTLILRDELRSIATIEDKGSSLVYPVRMNDEIPSKARILRVEPRRVVFLNLSASRREFIDLPEEPNDKNPRITLGTKGGGGGGGGGAGGGVSQVAPNQYNVARTEVDRALADLNNVLTQARAVPNFENGVASGYKLFQIVPGSIYDKLGLQNGDVITGLNGEPVNDPAKALAMLNELKTSNHLELQIKRDGRVIPNSYDIR